MQYSIQHLDQSVKKWKKGDNFARPLVECDIVSMLNLRLQTSIRYKQRDQNTIVCHWERIDYFFFSSSMKMLSISYVIEFCMFQFWRPMKFIVFKTNISTAIAFKNLFHTPFCKDFFLLNSVRMRIFCPLLGKCHSIFKMLFNMANAICEREKSIKYIINTHLRIKTKLFL